MIRKVFFTKLESASWNGNGFGTDSARWAARLDSRTGPIVGEWKRDRIFVDCRIDGEPRISMSYREWREAVKKQFETEPASQPTPEEKS